MNYIIFFLIIQFIFIILFTIYIWKTEAKEKLYKLDRDLLVNEIQLKLNEYQSKLLEHITVLSNVIDASSQFPQLANETLGQILNLFSTECYVPTLLTHNIHIGLPDFNISFKTPYEGYLYIKSTSCELYISELSHLTIKDELTNLYIPKDETVTIKDIKNLQKLQFFAKTKKTN